MQLNCMSWPCPRSPATPSGACRASPRSKAPLPPQPRLACSPCGA